MPDLTAVWAVLAQHPEQWAGMAMLFALAAGVVRWMPPRAASCSCGGDMDTCTCGTPRAPIGRAGAR